MGVPPKPPEPLTPEELQILARSRDKMDRFHTYAIENGELVVKVDELKSRFLDFDVDEIFSPDYIRSIVDDYLGFDGEAEGGSEPLPYGDDEESYSDDGKKELASENFQEKNETGKLPRDDENKEPPFSSTDKQLNNLKLYGKNEIMDLLQCGNQKALNFLKLLFQMEYAIKIGKGYFVREQDFDRFFEDFKGQEIAV